MTFRDSYCELMLPSFLLHILCCVPESVFLVVVRIIVHDLVCRLLLSCIFCGQLPTLLVLLVMLQIFSVHRSEVLAPAMLREVLFRSLLLVVKGVKDRGILP